MEQRRSFASLLKRHRLAAGLTHERLAELAALSARSISDLERGVSQRPRRETVDLLGAALQAGVRFVELAPVTSPDDVPLAIGRAFGVVGANGAAVLAGVADHVA